MKLLEPYTALPHAAPRSVWIALRIAVLVGTLALIAALFAGKPGALTLTWSLLFPILPALWLLAPGLWRNVCPMAFVNQIPRELGFSRALRRPRALRIWSYAISIALLLGAIVGRLYLFNTSAGATALLLAAALALAFAGGITFVGKSGWCGTFCPLAPVQKLYGQRPALLVRNEYCAPCVGCQTNCYDFNPAAALPADLFDRDQWSAGHRRFFAGMYPGFVAGYFLFPHFGPPALLAFPLVTLGLFETLRTFLKVSAYLLVVGFGLTALCTYYAYACGTIARGLTTLFGIGIPAQTPWWAEALVIVSALAIFGASVALERRYVRVVVEADVARVDADVDDLRSRAAEATGAAVSERSSGRRLSIAPSQSLLEAIEVAGIPLESGCRMGMCGADPILVVAGAEHLSAPGPEERSTLARLGLGPDARLACSCRATGAVTIDVDPAALREARRPPAAAVAVAETPTRRVVIVGNGAAGMSTAEHVRGGDPQASVVVVADEAYPFYNRMGIGRVIYGRTAMQGLTLLDDQWYERERIELWLNTRAVSIDRERRALTLATGDVLPYHRLVLATGATAAKPAIEGVDLPGSFVLRTVEDAADVRRWSQTVGARRAIVLGGGVLAVEAADALRRLGLEVTIAVRGAYLMDRSLDPTAARIVKSFLEGLTIGVRTGVSATAIVGDERVRELRLSDGASLETDLVVACVGVVPNTVLARAAGLDVRRGILVDERMQTSDPAILAVGDVAECANGASGLWPIGKVQGEVAAAAILGRDAAYHEPRAFAHIKLSGIEVRYFGDVGAAADDCLAFSEASSDGWGWRSLRLRGGRIASAVVVGYPDTARTLAGVLRGNGDLSAALPQLRAGDWSLVPRATGAA